MADPKQNIDETLTRRLWTTPLDPDLVRQAPAQNRTPSGTTGHESNETHNSGIDSPTVYTKESGADRRPPKVLAHLATEMPFRLDTLFDSTRGKAEESRGTKKAPFAPDALFETTLQKAHESHGTKNAASKQPPVTPYKNLPLLDSITSGNIKRRLEVVKAEADRGALSTVGKCLNRQYSELLIAGLEGKGDLSQLQTKETQVKEHEAYRAKWVHRNWDLEREVARGKTLILYARYGDYLASEYTTLCKDHKKAKGSALEGAAPMCTVVSGFLLSEEEEAKKQSSTVWQEPEHSYILQMCDGDEKAAQSTVTFIHEYATRNRLMHAGVKMYIDNRKWDELAARTTDDLAALDRLFDTTDEVEKQKCEDFARAIRKVRDKWLIREGYRWVLRRAVRLAEEAGIADLEPFANMVTTASDEEIHTKIQEAHDEAHRRAEDQARALELDAVVKKQRAAKLVDKLKSALRETTRDAERSNSEVDKLTKELADLQQKADDQEKVIQERDATIEKLEADIDKLQDMFEEIRKSKREVEDNLFQARIDIAGRQEEIEELTRKKNAGKAVGLPEV